MEVVPGGWQAVVVPQCVLCAHERQRVLPAHRQPQPAQVV